MCINKNQIHMDSVYHAETYVDNNMIPACIDDCWHFSEVAGSQFSGRYDLTINLVILLDLIISPQAKKHSKSLQSVLV